ncbi:MAG: lysophospholipid acyltransferase family protein [Bacillota bacterium]|jgi:1-acyl-sn-glycerol-3-phosphate acyltransferase|nr:lysophospholipid acyltransferase family protein [Bacillota bacterium]NLV61877.1 1-acyl-sn-glycerol-3-phosphate acyltransferase [Clostridiaceae bacterium]
MLYKFAAWLSKIFFRIFYKASFYGLENVPEQGALIMCSNHISMLDMFLFGPMIPRRIYFMAKQELFKIPVLKAILKSLGAYPVNRGRGDLYAAKTTLKLLEEGKIVGIFPEGRRRNISKKKQKPKSGAILFSIESGAPIVPVGIFGNYRLFSKMCVFYGKPYYPVPNSGKVSKHEMDALAQDLMDRIYSLDKR